MTTTVRQVREAVAAALEAIDGLTVTAFPVFQLIPPHAIVKEDEINYRQVFGTTLNAFDLTIVVFCGITDEQASQYFLDDLATIDGTNSIRGILEADETLGGVVDFIAVDSVGPVEVRFSAVDQNVLYLAREWSCRVDVTNS